MARQLGVDRVGLPLAADLIASFEKEGYLQGDGILHLASRLAHQHIEQWIAEDMCRTPKADITAVAASKQAIDAMNARRATMIEEINQWFEKSFISVPDAPLHTETFGSVVDRLGIAWVRSRRLSGDQQFPDHVVARQALKQLVELAEAYDCLVRDLRHGRRRVPRWKLLKSYGTSS
ncbi:DUF4254 domain-containing protein [Actinoallomurus purpureus]|uniref:DUF4254 domain-containing protein n=1 Tax=Actinoallomurus purpureus TaxID=478114 RepID=UPI002093F2DC|nr:DUF4254 domain-containing protein [Actinoallomurus purpureus]MCO6003774.1 DUF4254 domain-containing protein [Actinoallomurus purpureus]